MLLLIRTRLTTTTTASVSAAVKARSSKLRGPHGGGGGCYEEPQRQRVLISLDRHHRHVCGGGSNQQLRHCNFCNLASWTEKHNCYESSSKNQVTPPQFSRIFRPKCSLPFYRCFCCTAEQNNKDHNDDLSEPQINNKNGNTSHDMSSSGFVDDHIKNHWSSVAPCTGSLPPAQESSNAQLGLILNQFLSSYKEQHEYYYDEEKEWTDDDVDKNSQHILNGFAVLDCLLQQQQLQTKRINDQQQQQPTHLPLDRSILKALLTLWRNWILTAADQSCRLENESNSSQCTQHSSGLSLTTTTTTALIPPSPSQVWEKLQAYNHHGLFEPCIEDANIVLHVMGGKLKDNPSFLCCSEASNILHLLLEQSHHNVHNTQLHPNSETIHHIVVTCLASSTESSGKDQEPQVQADEYLKMLQSWYNETKLPCYRPTPFLYCAVMEAHAKAASSLLLLSLNFEPRAAVDRILRLYEEMKLALPEHKHDDVDASADAALFCYNRTLHALASIRNHSGNEIAVAARKIFDEMRAAAPQNHGIKPDRVSLDAVLTTYGRAGMSKEAQELFDDYMKEEEEEQPPPPPQVLSRNGGGGGGSMLHVLKPFYSLMWAHVRALDATMAEATLKRMVAATTARQEGWNQHGNRDLIDDSVNLWQDILFFWAHSSEPNADCNIKLIMEHLQQVMSESNNNDARPCNALLRSWARPREYPVDAARQLDILFSWMKKQQDEHLRPDGNSYFYAMVAWSNAKVPEKCESYLRKLYTKVMEGKLGEEALQARHFNTVIAAWEQLGSFSRAKDVFDRMKQSGIAPDLFTYNTMLRCAAAVVEDPDPGVLGMGIFQRLRSQWKDGLDQSVQPNKDTFFSLLLCLARSSRPDSLDFTEQVFAEMESMGVPLDVSVATKLVQTYVDAGRPNLLKKMFQFFIFDQRATLNDKLAHALVQKRLHAFSKAGNPEESTIALRDWIRASTCELPLVSTKPTTADFSAVLSAWRVSNQQYAWQKAESGVHQMIRLSEEGKFDCRPNRVSFAIVLSAYAESPRRLEDGQERTIALLDQLKALSKRYPDDESLVPNGETYSTILTAWCKNVGMVSAEQMFYSLNHHFDDVKTFGKVFQTRLRFCYEYRSAQMCQKVLDEWIANASVVDQLPTTHEFNMTLSAWALSRLHKAGNEAAKLLSQMVELSSTNKRFDCHPNSISCWRVISAYARSPAPGNEEKAVSLLNQFARESLLFHTSSSQTSAGFQESAASEFKAHVDVLWKLVNSHRQNTRESFFGVLKNLEIKPDTFWDFMNTKQLIVLNNLIKEVERVRPLDMDEMVQRLKNLATRLSALKRGTNGPLPP